MNQIYFADNLIKLRHEKHITQEQLADFIGVTKASVSKWETKQSMPDILLLPQLAAFFDVSLDDLFGYKPQLSKEQIQKQYQHFTLEFAHKPFEDVIDEVQSMVKQYYSCYSFLLQVCVLYLNHFVLAKDQKRQIEILDQTIHICQHIIDNCLDSALRHDATIIKSMIDLQCGRAKDVIDTLEDMSNPYHMWHSEGLLIQAYQTVGKTKQAHEFTQWSIYTHLVELISLSIQYLSIHMNELESCLETICRIDQVIETYHLDKLHPNLVAQYQFQNALIYCLHHQNELAITRLNQYSQAVYQLLIEDDVKLHGDEYFSHIDKYFEGFDLGVHPVRDKQMVLKSAIEALEHPLLIELKENKEFQMIKERLTKEMNEDE